MKIESILTKANYSLLIPAALMLLFMSGAAQATFVIGQAINTLCSSGGRQPSMPFNGINHAQSNIGNAAADASDSCGLCHDSLGTPGLSTFGGNGAGKTAATGINKDNGSGSPANLDFFCSQAANIAPIANAGPDQSVTAGDLVTLDGSASSDPDSDPLTYSWTLNKPAGSTATLSDATAAMPTFTADIAGVYTADLIVNDGIDPSASDSVTITAGPGNTAPVANAGPDQSVAAGDTVTLDGSASSDADSNPLSYSWILNRPAGSTASLSDPGAVMPTFVADVDGVYSADLVVNDGTENSPADSVVITANVGNTAPVANAGPDQSVATGDTVTLDSSASSDADSDPLTYSWSITSKPAGSAASLSDPGAAMPTFTADAAGDYVAQLIVNDGMIDSPADTVVIHTANGNSAPIANAGPDQSVAIDDTVTLDSSASSDADSDPLTYSWSITSKPAGSTASLSDPGAAMPTFVADVAGDYVAQLIVNDGTVGSTADSVVIHAANGNTAPIANAGPDQSVAEGDTVTLDGSASNDADSDPLTYSWSITSKPAGSTASLSDPGAAMPTFVADVAGDYVAQLIVNDGTVGSTADSVVIHAANGNTAPIANAGPDQSVNQGDTVTLDASGSSDADGNTLTYRCSFTSKPAGSSAVLSDTSVTMPTFVADMAGDYVVQFIVNDGIVDSAPDSVVVTAQGTAPPPPAVNVSLRLKVEPNVVEKVGKPIEIHGKARLDRSEMKKGERLPIVLEVGIEKPDGSHMSLMEKPYKLKEELEFEIKYRTAMTGQHKVYAMILGSDDSVLASESRYVMVVSENGDSSEDGDSPEDGDSSDDGDKAKEESRAKLDAIQAKMLVIAKSTNAILATRNGINQQMHYWRSKTKDACRKSNKSKCKRIRRSLRRLAVAKKRINKRLRRLNRIRIEMRKLT